MTTTYNIEVAVTSDTSTTEIGGILETFARQFLETQNYVVKQQVRLTSTEVDLLGTDTTTGERIFVECKAHRSPLAAETLHKLLGNVTFKNYSAGWLLSTSSLSKDARGFEHEWNQKDPSERRKLHIYPPDRLIQRLISAKILIAPNTLKYDQDLHKIGNEVTLLLTARGQFWILPTVDPSSGVQSAAFLFDATNGRAVTDISLLEWIHSTNASISLPWITEPASRIGALNKLRDELESVVGVPVADHWTDYRPARPEDFVGREPLQTSVFNFLDTVRLRTTNTRLIALKSPSGWGKSSSLLKIASRATNKRNKGRYFIFPVDSRAATTRRFPELAIATAFRAAMAAGFIRKRSDIEFGSSSHLFSTQAVAEIDNELRGAEKIICVFFDQFEELLYKANLVEVFDQLRLVCTALEEAQYNLAIGFSWKTDGVIPTEHSAYHMWHSLADRRLEIELSPFTEKEVTLATNRFAKELGQPLIPQIRRVLQDHCQGFPWLLKKLCIHMLDLSRSGIEQVDILNRSIDIQSLFRKDLENLSPTETGCIKQIASESPAEFFKISQNFGDDTVSSLINKRLVIRSGTRLTLYWDIFRDYILTQKIPFIPVTYVPQANFSRYIKALEYMNGKSELDYAELASQMNLSMGATDNLVRDLVNVGHVESNRKEHRLSPVFSSESKAIEIAFHFWRSHEIVRRLSTSKPPGVTFTEPEFIDLYRSTNKRAELDDNTVHAYALRTLRWLIGIGLVQGFTNALSLTDATRSSVRSFDAIRASKHRSPPGFFVGEAPPEKVVPAVKAIMSGMTDRQSLSENFGRNSCYVLTKLGFLQPDGTASVPRDQTDPVKLTAERALQTQTIVFVSSLLQESPGSDGKEIGKAVALKFNLNWSEASYARNGSALRQWATWCQMPAQLSLLAEDI